MRNRNKYKVIILLLSFLLFFNFGSVTYKNNLQVINAEPTTSVTPVITSDFTIEAKSSMLIDVDSGQILQAQNESEALPILSASKLLSVYVIYDQIKAGKLKLEDQVTVSQPVADLANLSSFSNVPLTAGNSYTVKDLLQAGLVVSANGAIMALAEKVAGSEQKFVEMMKAKADVLNLKNTFLYTSTGLDSADIADYGILVDQLGSNLMSARDGAILCWNLVREYPQIIETTKLANINFPSDKNSDQVNSYDNVDAMLPGFVDPTYVYDGVQGLKTGSSEQEDTAVFFGYYSKDNVKLVSIVIGAKTKESRFAETKKLLDYANNTLKRYEIVGSKSVITSPNFNLLRSKDIKVTPKFNASVYIFMNKGVKIVTDGTFIPDKKHYRQFNHAYTAPISKDANLGMYQFTIQGVKYLDGKDKSYSVNVVSDKDYAIDNNKDLYQNVYDFLLGIIQ